MRLHGDALSGPLQQRAIHLRRPICQPQAIGGAGGAQRVKVGKGARQAHLAHFGPLLAVAVVAAFVGGLGLVIGFFLLGGRGQSSDGGHLQRGVQGQGQGRLLAQLPQRAQGVQALGGLRWRHGLDVQHRILPHHAALQGLPGSGGQQRAHPGCQQLVGPGLALGADFAGLQLHPGALAGPGGLDCLRGSVCLALVHTINPVAQHHALGLVLHGDALGALAKRLAQRGPGAGHGSQGGLQLLFLAGAQTGHGQITRALQGTEPTGHQRLELRCIALRRRGPVL